VTDGLVIVDKAAGWTSHDVVARLRRLAGTRRVGHAGTLDPMATGVLVVGVDRATRLLAHLLSSDKAYTATVRLGQATRTDDADGEVISAASPAGLTEDAVRAAILTLTGEIQQRPSAVSAIKVRGQRSYKRVRAGEDVDLPARPVTVRRFEALAFDRPRADLVDVDVGVECSSGTYVRALARDLGVELGVGGHLRTLRRTRVGPFTVEDARTLEELAALSDPVTLPLPEAVRAAMPIRAVGVDEARELSFGRTLCPAGIAGTHAAIGSDGTVIALLSESEGRARPVLVFTPAG
jgi:tRNA pseudouridine55 synthase